MMENFLRKIRIARAAGPIHSEEFSTPNLADARFFDSDMSVRDRIELFRSRAAMPGSIVHQPDSFREIETIVRETVSPASTILVEIENELTAALRSDYKIISLSDADDDAIFNATAVITGVDFAIAETASIVLSSRQHQPRLASTTAEIHFALIRPDQIIPDLSDLPSAFKKYYGEKIPAGFTLISGPSKTSDIEMNLVVGVHGPAHMHMIIQPD
jgi:L-lactate utilization protein LutC